MLQINDLTITHLKDLTNMVENFSLVLHRGDKAVILGEEGNGKSTLLKWIFCPQSVEDYAHCLGTRSFADERLGYLPQEAEAKTRAQTVFEFFSESEEFFEQSPAQLYDLARKFGVESDFFYRAQKMADLSGGERVKAQLMRLVSQGPTVLLLDEPSNDLDVATLEFLERFLLQFDGIVLFISHDETLIERTANVIIHIERLDRKRECRHSVQRVGYRAYVSGRERAFAHQAQQAVSDRREKAIRDEKYRRIAQRVEHEQNVISRADPHGGRLLKKKMHAVKSLERRFAREDEEMTQMPRQELAILFQFSDEVTLPQGKTVLDFRLDRLCAPDGRLLAENIALHIRGPMKIGIVGANGAGKTTLLREIAKTLLPRSDLRAAYMPQNYEELLDLDKTPIEFLDLDGNRSQHIRTCLGALRYTPQEMQHPIRALSGGQKAKILLLKMQLCGANVLLLDEPTRNFSPLSAPVIRQMLAQFGGAVLTVSHDRRLLEEVCERVYRLTPAGLVPIGE